VLGRPLSKELLSKEPLRGSWRGVMSPTEAEIPGAMEPNGEFSLSPDLFSKRSGQPLWLSSSGRLTPLSFHGLR